METVIQPTGSPAPKPGPSDTAPPANTPGTSSDSTSSPSSGAAQPLVLNPSDLHIASDRAAQENGQPVSFGKARQTDVLFDWRSIWVDRRFRKGLKIAGAAIAGIFIILSLIYLV